MSQPLLTADIHSTHQAIQVGKSRPSDILEQARAVAQSDACRHVFMPGQLETTLSALSPSNLDLSLPLAGVTVSSKDLFDIAGQTTAAGSTVLA